MTATVYCDGSGTTRGNPGGWAAIIVLPHERIEIAGGHPDTTNNRMELTAAISGLTQAYAETQDNFASVGLYSDSEYVVHGINGRCAIWAKRNFRRSRLASNPMPNDELWRELWETIERRKVVAQWVRGHSGHPENERCDKLAGEMRRMLMTNPNNVNAITRRIPNLL